jgi:hypothetical protein
MLEKARLTRIRDRIKVEREDKTLKVSLDLSLTIFII